MLIIVTDSLRNSAENLLNRYLTRAEINPKTINIISLNQSLPKQTKLIVACGTKALRALTHDYSIAKTHCYILNDNKVNFPVIPVFCPNDVERLPELSNWLIWGLRKAKHILDHGYKPKDLEIISNPSMNEIIHWLDQAKASSHISIDIEKFRKDPHTITQIGFATSPTKALSIRLHGIDGTGTFIKSDEQKIWQAIDEILQGPQVKIFQNYIFDTLVLHHFGHPVYGPFEDTMVIANVLNPELKKGLRDLGRMYLFVPPWKDDNTAEHYNALDVLYTFDIFKRQVQELKARDLETFYIKHIKPLYTIGLEMCQQGIRINLRELTKLKKQLESDLKPLTQSLIDLAQPNTPKKQTKKKKRDQKNDQPVQINLNDLTNGLSPKAAKRAISQYRIDKKTNQVFLKAYKNEITLSVQKFNPKSPLQVKDVLQNMGIKLPTKYGKSTTDALALKKLLLKHPNNKFLINMLQQRKLSKLIDTYCNLRTDPDNRLRYQLNIAGTNTFRQSSSATGYGTGLNSQNIPKNFRQIIIPDPGKILVQVDLSQAELRVVAWLSQDQILIKMLNQDVHQYTANSVTRLTGIPCSRALGKMLNHATNYRLGANRLVDQCFIKEVYISKSQAEQLLKARLQMFPGIREWQIKILRQIKSERMLDTPWGWHRYFYGRIKGQEDSTSYCPVWNQACAFIPQHTVVMALNLAWQLLTQHIKLNNLNIQILQQGHDSLLMQTTQEQACIDAIDHSFSQVFFPINGVPRQIPWDISIGNNWRDLKERKSENA